MTISAGGSVEGSIGTLGVGEAAYRFMVFPFPPNHFMVHSFRGKEEISGLYRLDIVVTGPDVLGSSLERIALGQRALFLLRVGKSSRAFHGVVASVRHEGVRASHGVSQYRIRLVPRAWLLEHRRRSRIFQNMRVDQILAAVLKEAGIESRFDLQRTYPVREYCTQYEETDYRFIRRLAAEAGFYFRYSQRTTLVAEAVEAATAAIGGAAGAVLGAAASAALAKIFSGETMVFGDNAGSYAPIDHGTMIGAAASALAASNRVSVDLAGASFAMELPSPTLHYLSIHGTSTAAFDKVTHFEANHRVRTNAATYREYDPERPMAMITRHGQNQGSGAASVVDASVSLGPDAAFRADVSVDVAGALAGVLETQQLEFYEHHSPFLFPKWRYADDEPARILRQKRRKARVAEGASTCPALSVGHRFRLEDHPVHEINRAYTVTAVEHEGWATPPEGQREVYRNRFSCVPADVVFCPPRPKRKSVMVALTATVVGPPGAEIHTDPQGQIKVQFHWDREGQYNEHSSCWIRTMQAWGGPGWGTQFLPRVGMEVVVTFEGGDPDKPMVLGCLYNGTHPPSFLLPDDKTRSGIRTQSSPGGGGFNELSFEDRKGQEQIYLHAQRDHDEVVERNHTLAVHGDETIGVDGSRRDEVQQNVFLRVGGSLEEVVEKDHATQVAGNRIDVTTGNADRRVSGNLVTRVEGRERRDVNGMADLAYADDLTTRVAGCQTILVGRHDAKRSFLLHVAGVTTLSSSGATEIRTDKELVLRCGKSAIRLTESGIELEGPSLRLKGGASTLSMSDDGLRLKSEQAHAQILEDKIVLTTDAGASIALGAEVKIDGKKVLLNSPERATDTPPPEPGPTTKIELTDEEDGSALPYQRFVVKLDDGSEIAGVTDKDGKAALDLASGGFVVFPDATLPGDQSGAGPILPYVVRQGDYLDKLAFVHGFDADEVWNDEKNAALKAKRKDPNILHPGDVIHFARALRSEKPLQKGTSNQYAVKVPKKTVHLHFEDERLVEARYVVEGLGRNREGKTDGSGKLTIRVPVHTREVTVAFPDQNIVCPVRIGDMDPIEERSGVRQRLTHLGYRLPSDDFCTEAEAEALDRQALCAFQRDRGLDVTGAMDEATRRALLQAHGS